MTAARPGISFARAIEAGRNRMYSFCHPGKFSFPAGRTPPRASSQVLSRGAAGGKTFHARRRADGNVFPNYP